MRFSRRAAASHKPRFVEHKSESATHKVKRRRAHRAEPGLGACLARTSQYRTERVSEAIRCDVVTRTIPSRAKYWCRTARLSFLLREMRVQGSFTMRTDMVRLKLGISRTTKFANCSWVSSLPKSLGSGRYVLAVRRLPSPLFLRSEVSLPSALIRATRAGAGS